MSRRTSSASIGAHSRQMQMRQAKADSLQRVLAGLFTTDEQDGGAILSFAGVPQVADELEASTAELLGFVADQDVGPAGQAPLEETVQLAGERGEGRLRGGVS
ncbi:hypothetical protein AB0D89_28615 [Streptomyces luteogriseus]|uniref:hypothetical protein n=1 Tax=Streptomyces TaxID=1883 RepID=UPI000691AC73|nr:hypothetical protein [Streptomyces sp. NRRL S-475]